MFKKIILNKMKQRNLKKDFIGYAVLSAILGFIIGLTFQTNGFEKVLYNMALSAFLGGLGGIIGYQFMVYIFRMYSYKMSPSSSGLKNFGVNTGKNFLIKKILILPFLSFPLNFMGVVVGLIVSYSIIY